MRPQATVEDVKLERLRAYARARIITFALVIGGMLVACVVIVYFFSFPVRLVGAMRAQMQVGSAYMKSLHDSDVPAWIERTKDYLAEYQPGSDGIGVYGTRRKPVPPDLAALKIIRIDIWEDHVGYVWMGGMDHTELIVFRLRDGTFTVTARYNDENEEVIWPKKPNQTDAANGPWRCGPTFMVARNSSLQTTRALRTVADLASR